MHHAESSLSIAELFARCISDWKSNDKKQSRSIWHWKADGVDLGGCLFHGDLHTLPLSYSRSRHLRSLPDVCGRMGRRAGTKHISRLG